MLYVKLLLKKIFISTKKVLQRYLIKRGKKKDENFKIHGNKEDVDLDVVKNIMKIALGCFK